MRVLVAVDCSEVSAEVLAAAAQLLSASDEIRIVRVVDPSEEHERLPGQGPDAGRNREVGTPSGGTVHTGSVLHVPAETAIQATERVRAERLHDLERLARAMLPADFNWQAAVVTGTNVAESILQTRGCRSKRMASQMGHAAAAVCDTRYSAASPRR